MSKSFSFVCSSCGKLHEGSPSFAYSAPSYYNELSDDEKSSIASLSDDSCMIKHPDQTDRFIRVILEVPIHGADQPFLWGVWISLSERNFEKYRENFDSPTYEDDYFGWFCNRLPYYPETLGLKTRAYVKPGKERPRIELEPSDHPLYTDYHEGITWEKAIEIAEVVMHAKRT